MWLGDDKAGRMACKPMWKNCLHGSFDHRHLRTWSMLVTPAFEKGAVLAIEFKKVMMNFLDDGGGNRLWRSGEQYQFSLVEPGQLHCCRIREKIIGRQLKRIKDKWPHFRPFSEKTEGRG